MKQRTALISYGKKIGNSVFVINVNWPSPSCSLVHLRYCTRFWLFVSPFNPSKHQMLRTYNGCREFLANRVWFTKNGLYLFHYGMHNSILYVEINFNCRIKMMKRREWKVKKLRYGIQWMMLQKLLVRCFIDLNYSIVAKRSSKSYIEKRNSWNVYVCFAKILQLWMHIEYLLLHVYL